MFTFAFSKDNDIPWEHKYYSIFWATLNKNIIVHKI